jgi:hypothetical protein
LALAFQECKPGQSHHEAIIMAWLGSAYLGLAWPSPWPKAGPSTTLDAMLSHISSNSEGSFFLLYFCTDNAPPPLLFILVYFLFDYQHAHSQAPSL